MFTLLLGYIATRESEKYTMSTKAFGKALTGTLALDALLIVILLTETGLLKLIP